MSNDKEAIRQAAHQMRIIAQQYFLYNEALKHQQAKRPLVPLIIEEIHAECDQRLLFCVERAREVANSLDELTK